MKIRVSVNASKEKNEAGVPVADMRLFSLLGPLRTRWRTVECFKIVL